MIEKLFHFSIKINFLKQKLRKLQMYRCTTPVRIHWFGHWISDITLIELLALNNEVLVRRNLRRLLYHLEPADGRKSATQQQENLRYFTATQS